MLDGGSKVVGRNFGLNPVQILNNKHGRQGTAKSNMAIACSYRMTRIEPLDTMLGALGSHFEVLRV